MKKIVKKILTITIITSVLVITMFIVNYSSNNKEILKSTNINVSKDKAIAIMLSNENGDGYYESSSDTFPTNMMLNTTLSTCENGGTISYDGTNVTVEVNRSDKCYVFFDDGSPKAGSGFADYIASLYTEDGANNLYFHDQRGEYGTYEAGDMSYRYSGASNEVNNYVCFGSDLKQCPSDNYYRIIGVIDGEVKLIKSTPGDATLLGTNGRYHATSGLYFYNGTYSNNWASSELNTINLNTNYVNYLNNIDTKWMTYIDVHLWKAGGNTTTYIYDTAGAQNVYYREITSPAFDDTCNEEIGLIYVSDYMYAATPSNWSLKAINYNNTNSGNNWLNVSYSEWVITHLSDSTSVAYYKTSGGQIYSANAGNTNYVFNIRPTFYLKTNVKYYSGSGTTEDPYRIYIEQAE